MLTPEEAQERLGIGKSQYYEALKALNIKAQRVDGKAVLSPEQFEAIAAYRAQVSGTAIATVSEESDLDIPASPETVTPDSDDFRHLIRRAQELKAQQLLQPHLVLMELAQQMTEDDLPPDLRSQVEEARNPRPLVSPAAIAHRLLAQFRSGNP